MAEQIIIIQDQNPPCVQQRAQKQTWYYTRGLQKQPIIPSMIPKHMSPEQVGHRKVLLPLCFQGHLLSLMVPLN